MIERPPSLGHSGPSLASALGNGAVAAIPPLLLPHMLLAIAVSLLLGEPGGWGELLPAIFLRGVLYDHVVLENDIALLGPPLIAFVAGALLGRKVGLWLGISLSLLGSCWLFFLVGFLAAD
jgi:hypothetical protein